MHYLETAVDIAREAGALLANYFERRVPFELKGEFDLVTEADRSSERLVVERLRSHFPTHTIVAEEGGGHESASEYRWYVDPLDGTTNFAHSFPMFNVTLGLARGSEVIAGVIYDPIRQEMFTAERGGGAYLNHRRIHVSATRQLGDSLASTGFPSRKRHHNVNIHFYYQLAMASHGVRRTGNCGSWGWHDIFALPEPEREKTAVWDVGCAPSMTDRWWGEENAAPLSGGPVFRDNREAIGG